MERYFNTLKNEEIYFHEYHEEEALYRAVEHLLKPRTTMYAGILIRLPYVIRSEVFVISLLDTISATGHDIFRITMSINDFFCRTDDIHTSVSGHVETVCLLSRKDK